MKKYDIGFKEALKLAIENIKPFSDEKIKLTDSVGRISSGEIASLVDSPSIDASIKDGYAVIAQDIATASAASPVKLNVIGSVGAGDNSSLEVTPGKAVRVMSGAPIPRGAESVLSEEFTDREDDHILAKANSHKGRNILYKGVDVKKGEILAGEGQRLTPGIISLLAAGGIFEVSVYRKPRVGLLATGSEVLLPGSALEKGKLYASNIALQNAWLTSIGLETEISISEDDYKSVEMKAAGLLKQSNILLTSGGAWKSDRDLIAEVMSDMGAEIIFHRVRMGPGKAVGMAIFNDKPVFFLPGGPTSNEMAFIMIALPAIMKMAGLRSSPYMFMKGKLAEEIRGQTDWTQLVECTIEFKNSDIILHPVKMKSRLASMARSQAIVMIPEGIEHITAGNDVHFICLDFDAFTVRL